MGVFFTTRLNRSSMSHSTLLSPLGGGVQPAIAPLPVGAFASAFSGRIGVDSGARAPAFTNRDERPVGVTFAERKEAEETEEERGQRIAQQWIHGDSESTGRVEPPAAHYTSTDDDEADDANLTPEERKKRDMDRMIAEAARNQAIAEGAGGIPAGAYESNTDAIPDPEPATSMGEAAGDDADDADDEMDDETDDETDESGSGGGFF